MASAGWQLTCNRARGLFMGSGSDGLNLPVVCETILSLVHRPSRSTSPVKVLYIGTATYDQETPRTRQTARFVEAGCDVDSLDCALAEDMDGDAVAAMAAQVASAEVIIVSGGNTLFAVDRWNRFGLRPLLLDAMGRGCVMCGGSAGAICWFDGGHSDSMDPDSYRQTMIDALCCAAGPVDESALGGERKEGDEDKAWPYIRCPCLGFFPGLMCPHHDKVQSNGVLRATDFEKMLLRHPGELGICIDHWAALVLPGDGSYSVLSVEGKEGSVLFSEAADAALTNPEKDADGVYAAGAGAEDAQFSADRAGVGGIWLKRVEEGQVRATLCPWRGQIEDILRQATKFDVDPNVDVCRAENPSGGAL